MWADAAARVAKHLVGRALEPSPAPLAVEFWTGARMHVGPAAPAKATLHVRSPAVLWRLLRRPTTLAMAESFMDGLVDVDGDLFEPVRAGLARSAGTTRSRRRTHAARDIGFHYDVSNEFYALFLDPHMVYTCAYYPTPDTSLADAQEAKLDLVCRKLDLRPGDRLLDLGCGWGALAIWAAQHFGADVVGVTLSEAQARYAADAVARAGLSERVRIEHRDWRASTPDAAYDKISAIGLIEHVGLGARRDFFAMIARALAPGGRALVHGITNRPDSGWSDAMEVLSRHVFPGAEFAPVSAWQTDLEAGGFEIVDVENLRAHYARTTRQWADRLLAAAPVARALVGDRTYRTWRAYLVAASVSFEAGWIALHQVVVTPVADAKRWTTPRVRPALPGPRAIADVS